MPPKKVPAPQRVPTVFQKLRKYKLVGKINRTKDGNFKNKGQQEHEREKSDNVLFYSSRKQCLKKKKNPSSLNKSF